MNNITAIITANNDKISIRNRYFLIRIIIIREAVKSSVTYLKYMLPSEVVANNFIKALSPTKYADFYKMFNISST